MFLQISNLTKRYQKGQTTINALDDVSLSIRQGEFVALTGPSGSGKTTLLNIIGGLDAQDSGSVLIGGQPQRLGSDRQSSAWRAQNIGFVFQFSNLLPYLTAAQNVELPLLLTNLSVRERASRVASALELVGLSERARHKPAELSGGQEQRVAIARAFVSAPKLMLCDEPTGDLDRKSAQVILSLLNTLKQEFNKTILMVTHDMEAAAATDRQVVLDKGRLRLAGEPLPEYTFKSGGER